MTTSLVDAEALALFMGRDLATINVERAQELLDDAGDLVRDELNQRLDVETETIRLTARGGSTLMLPELPVVAVSELVEHRGSSSTVLVEGVGFRLEAGYNGREGILRRLSAATAQWPDGDFVDVTYTHGYSTGDDTGLSGFELPRTIQTVIKRAAARGFTNPGGHRQENIGRYSYTDPGDNPGLFLTAGDLHDLGPFYPGGRAGRKQ